jgi:hypothetical protein
MEASTAYLSAQVNTVEPSGNVKIDSITRMLNKAARQFGALYEWKCVAPMNVFRFKPEEWKEAYWNLDNNGRKRALGALRNQERCTWSAEGAKQPWEVR